MSLIRRAAGAATPALALLLALPAAAQTAPARPTLLDFFSPDRIAARVLQMGILSLRTQADIVYGSISTSALAGSATITDVKVWPILDWNPDGTCQIGFDRVRLSTVPLDEMDHFRLKMQLSGGTVTPDCLPPEAKAGAAMVLDGDFRLSRATVDFDYRISTASALVHVQLVADDLAALSATADLDYLWMDASDRFRDPLPVVFLNSARLTVENLGLWEKVLPMLPPMVTDAAQAGAMIDEGIAQIDPMAQTPLPQLQDLADSAKVAWSDFLADPRRLVLETGFTDAPRYLDIEKWDREGLGAILDDLVPQVETAPASARAVLSAALISKAYDTPEALTDPERISAGRALATGAGAPRDPGQADRLLRAGAEAGDGAAAMILATMQEVRNPEDAYALALVAAEQGADGAAGLLDRLEGALPLARVLEIQHARVEGVEHPVESLESLTLIRDEAGKRMTGKGRTRSYEIAALWAMLGAAAGDAECAGILAEIDELVRLGGPEAQAVWQQQEAASSELARSAWIGFDLPAEFGGVK